MSSWNLGRWRLPFLYLKVTVKAAAYDLLVNISTPDSFSKADRLLL
jgi:hypothetical protein